MIKVVLEVEKENGCSFEMFYASEDNTLRIFERDNELKQFTDFYSVVDYDEFLKALKFAKNNG